MSIDRFKLWGRPRADVSDRDEGSALILALVLILVGTMMVLPVMDYTMSVTKSNRVTDQTAVRSEAVKGGLRAAMYDPVALYQACVNSGRTTAVQLAVPPDLNIKSSCTTTQDALQDIPSDQRYALATTQVGSNANIPAPYVASPARPELNGTMGVAWCTSMAGADENAKIPCGKPYPNNGAADPNTWMVDAATASGGGKIYTPYLPPLSNTLRFAAGYDMLDGDGPGTCRAYFPGKYTDDVVITDAEPVYFASGIYYFEKALRISGNANVVVGSGAVPGCVDSDALAVADRGAPFSANSTGVGGTFVFGENGRLVIDTSTATTAPAGMSLKFNRRLVAKTDPFAILNDVSIMSVNGVFDGVATTSALDIPGQLHVPVTGVWRGSAPDLEPYAHSYRASKLVSTATGAVPCALPLTSVTAACPIVDINLTSNAKINLKIPGYVSIPQGSFSLMVGAGAGVNKTLSFGGGILAAQMAVPGEAPAFLQLGLLNPVVQKTFKITTETVSGLPKVVSVALVQVNETGGNAVNSWVVQPL